MCGIVGQLALSHEAMARDALIPPSLVELMARRGPDGAGAWSDGTGFAAAFRRLAVLDLSSNADQPMVTPDGQYALVYNGEVYNFRELRRELQHHGLAFRSTGDTEVVLQALAHWGKGALPRFNGMFALAFYDKEARRLLLARDHAGIKPLYYMVTRSGVVFASQYDQILAHPWSRGLGVSAQALGLYLRLGYIPAPYGLLEDTHMLEPGTWLEVAGDAPVREGRFFEFPEYREADLAGKEAHEAVDAAVTAAVRRHLVADVPTGTFLSGGIDSPLIAAKMREVSAAPILAFTMATGGDELDESPDAIAYARELGVDHVIDLVTTERVLAMLDDVVAATAEPFADYSIFPTMAISRLASSRVKVMLSGDGGDELFFGYTGRIAGMMAMILELDRPEAEHSRRWDVKKLFALGSGQDDPRWPSTLGDVHRLNQTQKADSWLPSVFPDCATWPADFSLFRYSGWEPDRTAQWMRRAEFVGYLPLILQKVDRGSMFHSLEVRVPLLDREVIDVATRLHWRDCLDPVRRLGKLPLRRSLARHVKHQSLTKRGFTVPMAEWLRGPLRLLFEQAVLGRNELVGLSMNRTEVEGMFQRHLSRRADHGWPLWVLLSLALWEDRHYHRSA